MMLRKSDLNLRSALFFKPHNSIKAVEMRVKVFLFILLSWILLSSISPSNALLAKEVDITQGTQFIAFSPEAVFQAEMRGIDPLQAHLQLTEIARSFCHRKGYDDLISYEAQRQTTSGQFLDYLGATRFIPLSRSFYFKGDRAQAENIITFQEYFSIVKTQPALVYELKVPEPRGGIYFSKLICSSLSDHFIEEHSVSLVELPRSRVLDGLQTGKEITLGDLHGNALKLVHFLVREGVFEVDEDTYDDFAAIYAREDSFESSAADEVELAQFETWLESVHVKKGTTKIRLIGDTLCDRGANDYFTLRILDKLVTAGRPLEIILSNHDLGFLFFYQALQTASTPLPDDFISQVDTNVAPATSLHRLIALLRRFPTRIEEVKRIVTASYLPSLRLLGVNKNKTTQKMALFSHAYTGIEAVAALSELFKIDNCSLDDIREHPLLLQSCILLINSKLRDKLSSQESCSKFLEEIQAESEIFNRLTPSPGSGSGSDSPKSPERIFPVHYAIWHRQPGSPLHFRSVQRPKVIGSYRVDYVFGHVGEEVSIDEGNLDTYLGKGDPAEPGLYRVHIFY